MLGITVRNVAVVVVLIAASGATIPGVAAPRVSDQPPQHVTATPIGGGKLHVSWLEPLETTGSTTSYRYKIQWKSGSQEYSETREAISTGSNRDIVNQASYLDNHVLRYDWFHRIAGLKTGVAYTVRVIRTSADDDSQPSNEATATPIRAEEILRTTVEKLITQHGGDSPWIQQTWQYLQDNNIPFYIDEVDSGASGKYDGYCEPDPVSELHLCSTRAILLDDPMNEDLILHEFAHAYSLDVKILEDHPEKAEGIGIAFVYLDTLLEEANGICNREEFLADLMGLRDLGDKADLWYWTEYGHTPITDKALGIIGRALKGNRPEWFTETYSESGVPNLEQLWTDIQQFAPRIANYHKEEQKSVVYHLRNAFGGYCDNANATVSMFGDGPTRNPWRDGGCVPAALLVRLASDSDGDASVSWTVPGDDGGAPIEGYRLQWKSDGQQYDRSRQVVISDPSTLYFRLDGLVPGIRHQVRVLAYNTNGDGTPSDDVTVVTDGNPYLQAESNPTWSAGTVTSRTETSIGQPDSVIWGWPTLTSPVTLAWQATGSAVPSMRSVP